MLKIQKKEPFGVPVSSFKIGDTFIYDNTLYMIIDMNGTPKYLNMKTACIEKDNISYLKSVSQVQCLVTYDFL